MRYSSLAYLHLTAFVCVLVGVRALDGSMTDLLERDAFAAKHSINDIYSCSWGPEDDGKTVDGPHTLAKVSHNYGVFFSQFDM